MYERERRNSIFHSLLPWLLPSGRFRSLGASFTAHSFARIYIYSRRVLLFLSFFFPSTPFLNINLTPKCRNPATLHCVIPRTRGYIKDALLHLFRLHPSILYYTTTTITRSLPSLIPTAQCCKKKNNLVFFFFCSWCLCCWHPDSIVNPRCSFFTCQLLPYRYITADSFIIWNACRTGIQREYIIKSPLTQENFNKKYSLIHGWYILSIVSSLSRHTFVVQHRLCVVSTHIFNCLLNRVYMISLEWSNSPRKRLVITCSSAILAIDGTQHCVFLMAGKQLTDGRKEKTQTNPSIYICTIGT